MSEVTISYSYVPLSVSQIKLTGAQVLTRTVKNRFRNTSLSRNSETSFECQEQMDV